MNTEPITLEIYFGCSRWTNASSNHAGHISLQGGTPLCGKNFSNGASERIVLSPINEGQATCLKCKNKAKEFYQFSN